MPSCSFKKLIFVVVFAASAVLHAPIGSAQGVVGALPSLGDAGGAELSVQDERKLGELIMRDYRAFGQINEDPEISAYLNKLGAKIAQAAGASSTNFEFFLVTDKSINAFALPGGFVGVHTGLVASAQTESELASVLSHEVGHVTQRHIARMFGQQKQTSLVSTAAVIAALLVASSNPQAAQGLVAAGAGYSIDQQLGFSRDAEREADRVGFSTLKAAGFETQGMVDFFGRLQKSARLYENNAPTYLRSHPLTAERIADIRNRAGLESSSGDSSSYSLEYDLIRVKSIVYGEKTAQQLNDKLKVFAGPLEQENIKNPIALAYGRSLVLTSMGKQAEALDAVDLAISLFRKSQSVLRPEPVPALLAHQKMEVRLAQYASERGDEVAPREPADLNAREMALFKALDAFKQASPNDMPTRLLYASGLQRLGLHRNAEAFLRELAVVYKTNASLYDLAAQSALALGKRGEHHLFLAQSYATRGAFLPAVEQTQIAKRFASDNYYLQAEIDAKQRDFKLKADEQRQFSKLMN